DGVVLPIHPTPFLLTPRRRGQGEGRTAAPVAMGEGGCDGGGDSDDDQGWRWVHCLRDVWPPHGWAAGDSGLSLDPDRGWFTVGIQDRGQEADSPELAVTKLFASARRNSDQLREYGALTHCMHNLPSEGQIRKTAVEVQHLLVSGRRKEALQCAQEGQLWGPALVLAAQLGDKFYIDTVKQMAHRQFVSGSPLRTLCLLIAGQPADVFSMDSSNNSLPVAVNVPQQPVQIQFLVSVAVSEYFGRLELHLVSVIQVSARERRGILLELFLIMDPILFELCCLCSFKMQVTAAHTCYLVAEAKFESYSDKARLCLIGADHWKCPRTYASPEAIQLQMNKRRRKEEGGAGDLELLMQDQRTELYEYSKVLGNSQFILLPFQPYKLVYAYMLAEVGKVSEALKYCQAILKSLKSSGRDPEVETWKGLVSSLEERLRAHQQGGYSTNLAPAKLVGKLFTSIDRSLHRMIGAPPPPLPPTHPNQSNEHDNISMAPKVGSSQSTMAMSSLLPSASVETISEWTSDSRKSMHNRSISEPDFGRSPKQINPSGDGSSADLQSKAPGASRLGLIGAQFFQKTIGWMSRSRQAKLGEKNKFYYDEKLKRWVEEGAEPPAEEAALPPPPTTTSFQNHAPEYSTKNAFSSENISSNGMLETKSSSSTEHSPGMPPMPPMQNQFSARGRMGVRSRYVDTFNKGGGTPGASFQSPSVPSVKPVGGAKFFVPSPVAASESTADSIESTQVASSTEGDSAPVGKESSFSPLPSSSFTMQRFPSMDNIPSTRNKGMGTPSQNGNGSLSSRSRAASWSGSYSDAFNVKMANTNPSGEGLGVPSSFSRSPSPLQPTTSLHTNGSSLSDDLHEVEL
ncbi:hypothetical protein Taro_031425, partial [Colocasia esculenta]|nr:hypothetical protein [Colocasia esculenta]